MGNSFDCLFSQRMSAVLPAEIFEATAKHTSTLIFLHGLGDDGKGWASSLKSIVPKYCKVICPHAPTRPVTLNGGMHMPAWFDIIGLHPDAEQDEVGIKKTSTQLDKLIIEEIERGITADRILIGGFSMGGAVALYNGLTSTRKLGGLLCLSTWLPMHTTFMQNPRMVQLPRDVPILQGHGDVDQLIPLAIGRMTHTYIVQYGFVKADLKVYSGMGHSSSDNEMKDIQKWITTFVPEI